MCTGYLIQRALTENVFSPEKKCLPMWVSRVLCSNLVTISETKLFLEDFCSCSRGKSCVTLHFSKIYCKDYDNMCKTHNAFTCHKSEAEAVSF